MDYLEKHRQAGEVVKKVVEESRAKIKEGVKLLDVATFIEGKITEYGAETAFPVNISLNEVAAHYTPPSQDETVLEKGDYLTLDIGCHVEGYIADTAYTVKVGEPEDELIQASQEGLDAALSVIRAGITTGEVGKVIEKAITAHGFRPIENLTGHGLSQYSIHASPSIPNFDDGSTVKLREGDVVAVEPFATTGAGRVVDDDKVYIFSFVAPRPLRLEPARKLMHHIQNTYPQLPFAERWVVKDKKGEFLLRLLIRNGILFPYHVLKEKTGAPVTQAEHSVIVTEEGCDIFT
ncbi:MAG: type II methionyl aminopeptidase [Theionarchaea archaeon]|nr:type II methionyl aminopeptidase [Theionarchaea archaeon]MBU7036639.1 type II methionyl aminopeptidase [Theionarchaea archaeon]